MLVTILSWFIILLTWLLLGLLADHMVNRLFKYSIKSIYSIVIAGMVISAIYAETFSIFYKVGKAAFVLLLLICLFSMLITRARLKQIIKESFDKYKNNRLGTAFDFVFLVLLLVFAANFSSMTPYGYDVLNYHIPAIRWIEEYGVVKGLANLHCRFAHNSAIWCIQALYSFSWIYKYSMHSLNGFVWLFFVSYCLSGLKLRRYRKIYLSDLYRVILLMLLFRQAQIVALSEPRDDLSVFCFVGFIFIEWCSIYEDGEDSYIPYGLLSVVGLFSLSLKLSAAVLAFFAIKPLIEMIGMKKYKDISKFIVLCFFSIGPYLIRNVILSGYLIYPVYSIDLFDVDWKIPKSVIVSGNVIIKVFARAWGGGYAYSDYSRPFKEWFLIWLRSAEQHFDILAIIDFIIVFLVILLLLYILKTKKAVECDIMLLIEAVIGFLFLMFSAPSLRFGRIFFFVLPTTYIYFIFSMIRCDKIVIDDTVKKVENHFKLAGLIILLCCFVSCLSTLLNHGICSEIVEPGPYADENSTAAYESVDGTKIYYYEGIEGTRYGLNSYYGFPGTECQTTLQYIKLRGSDVSEGFRVKDEAKTIPYDFQGHLLNQNELNIMGLSDLYN